MFKTKAGIWLPEIMLPKKTIDEQFGIKGEVAVLVLDRKTGILKRKIGGGNSIMPDLLLALANNMHDTYNTYGHLVFKTIDGYIATTDIEPMASTGGKGSGLVHGNTEPTDETDWGTAQCLMETDVDDVDPGGTTDKYRQFLGILDEGVIYNETGWLVLCKGVNVTVTSGATIQANIQWAKYAQNIDITAAEKVHVHWKVTLA